MNSELCQPVASKDWPSNYSYHAHDSNYPILVHHRNQQAREMELMGLAAQERLDSETLHKGRLSLWDK